MHIHIVNFRAAMVLLRNDNGFGVAMELETVTGLEAPISPRNAGQDWRSCPIQPDLEH